jgi:hypothetical protein
MTDSYDVKNARLSLVLCGSRRKGLADRTVQLRHDTERALREARRVGIPLAEACVLAGISRSSAYARYAVPLQGGDDAGNVDNGSSDQAAVA